jgi:hypothetical protein
VQRRFYRTEASRHTPGSGLGLALVAAVTRLHGMDLTISDADTGCRVTISRAERVAVAAPVVSADGEDPQWAAATGKVLT